MATETLKMPATASRKRLVIAMNNPKARFKDGKRDAIKLQIAVPVDQMTDRRMAIAEQIETLMFELMKAEAADAR